MSTPQNTGPDAGDPEGAVGHFLERLSSAVAMFGGITLLFIMLISSISVIGRNIPQLINLFGFKLSPMSIPGDIEIVQLGCAVAIFAFLPYCAIKRANVFVDFFTGWMPVRARAAFDVAANLLYLAITLLIAWQLGHGTMDKFATKDTTMVLRIPEAWPYAMAAGGGHRLHRRPVNPGNPARPHHRRRPAGCALTIAGAGTGRKSYTN
jgi:TRAP-type C4-dicarboxylate transport system permease small subunit